MIMNYTVRRKFRDKLALSSGLQLINLYDCFNEQRNSAMSV